MTGEVGTGVVAEIPQPNTGLNIEVVKPQIFNRKAGKVLRFLTTCRLFIRMRIRNDSVEEKIQ